MAFGQHKGNDSNPFVPTPAPATPLRPAHEDSGTADTADPVGIAGPPAPTGAPPPQRPPLRLPAWALDPRYPAPRLTALPAVQVAGLHGGAGATSVASLLGPTAADCGHGLAGLLTLRVPVVLVARTHGSGLDLIRRAGQQWASGGLNVVRLLGLILIDDAAQLGDLKRDVQSASHVFPMTWRIGWHEQWRLAAGPPHHQRLPSRVWRVQKEVLGAAADAAAAGFANTSTNMWRKTS